MQRDQVPVRSDVDDIFDQHATLRDILRDLGERPGLDRELELCEQLQTMLIEHFELEEQPGGYFARVLEDVPEAVGSVDKLMKEHAGLTVHAAEVVRAIRACLDGPVADVRARIDELAAALSDHERREADLLADAMFNDIGGLG